ncbi:hypothetical protein KY338_02195 [Candidatus Woesearchaeota archaeon]|nr:hypothetical protein [Candidatus Woesearchaeota archaeon]MBW3006102.1 hypothetical protein [Candidatus Woesearchaeota archaeon]
MKKKWLIGGTIAAAFLAALLPIARAIQALTEAPGMTIEEEVSQEVSDANQFLRQQTISKEAIQKIKDTLNEDYSAFIKRTGTIKNHLDNTKSEYISYGAAAQLFQKFFPGVVETFQKTGKISIPKEKTRDFAKLCSMQIDRLNNTARELDLAHNELINLKGDYEGKVENIAKVFFPYAKVILDFKRNIKEKIEATEILKIILSQLSATSEKEVEDVWKTLEK